MKTEKKIYDITIYDVTIYDITYMYKLKRNDTDELTYKTERDSQTLKTNLQLMEGRGSWGVWDRQVHTAIFKMENQQGPTV